MNAIVTGSQKYGRPRLDSDVDLVILVSEEDLLTLKRFAGEDEEPPKDSDSDPGTAGTDNGLTASLRFGPLNVICCTDPIAFAVWQKGTKQLMAERPVTKQRAIEHFRALRLKHGLSDKRPAESKPGEDETRGPGPMQWRIGDPVRFQSNGRSVFALITKIYPRREVVDCAYGGHDWYCVKMSALERAEFTDGYRRADKR